MKLNDGGIITKISLPRWFGHTDGAKLIAARYDNDRMTDVKTVDHPEASGTVTLSDSGGSFKLFSPITSLTCRSPSPRSGRTRR